MGEDPRAIRAQIEETRARMGGTVEALSYRTDVKARTKDAIAERKDAVVNRITDVKEAIVGTASDAASAVGDAASTATSAIGDAMPDGEQVKASAKRGVSVAEGNPLGLAIGALALGFLTGMLVPSSRMENKRLGELSDQVKEGVKETVTTTASQAVDHGKQLVDEVAQSAKDTAQQSAPEHGRELQAAAQQQVEQAADNIQEAASSAQS
jgi:gas vesicle protein